MRTQVAYLNEQAGDGLLVVVRLLDDARVLLALGLELVQLGTQPLDLVLAFAERVLVARLLYEQNVDLLLEVLDLVLQQLDLLVRPGRRRRVEALPLLQLLELRRERVARLVGRFEQRLWQTKRTLDTHLCRTFPRSSLICSLTIAMNVRYVRSLITLLYFSKRLNPIE